MVAAWTTFNPGAGRTGSLESLREKLRILESALDSGQQDLDLADDVFHSDWLGVAATAAQSKMKSLAKRISAEESAVSDVKRAIGVYVDEIKEIKALSKAPLAKWTAATDQLQIERIQNPQSGSPYYSSSAREASNEAYTVLVKLGKRRQEADNEILASVRAVVATTWSVAPKDFPTTRGWTDSAEYDYSMDHPLGFSSKKYSAKQLMDFFKNHPSEVFPFPVSGTSSTFKEGAVFTLSDTITPITEVDFETGEVVVTTTDTSVKFTVISDTYFDGPGSTIEFSIVEMNGEFVLRKVAHAVHSNIGVAPFAELGAGGAWSTQAQNLKNVVKKYEN